MPAIDTAAVARITGFDIGTLNVWVQRQLIPGVEVGQQGRARTFTLDEVLHVALMSALVRLRHAAPFASQAASIARAEDPHLDGILIIGPPRRGWKTTPTIDFITGAKISDLDRLLDGFNEGRPEGFTAVDCTRLAARVRKFVEDPDAAERIRRARGALTGTEAVRRARQERLSRENE